jgi:hypothetical protein
MIRRYGLIFLVAALAPYACGAEPRPLVRAHAHNDYEHGRPLLDALSHGFCSVEADVFLVDEELLVAHNRGDVTAERTLQSLYLEPLRRQIRRNGGRVFRDGPLFWLLIDIKSDAAATYQALHAVLTQYSDIVVSADDGRSSVGAVRVVVSGNRDQAAIEAARPRYAGIDGRITDLESKKSNQLMPWISDNWRRHFQWRGSGEFSDEEREKLRAWVSETHAGGRLLRLWGTPDGLASWKVLHEAGVDLINTDDLAGLQSFLMQYE